jgi:hypothetical protein
MTSKVFRVNAWPGDTRHEKDHYADEFCMCGPEVVEEEIEAGKCPMLLKRIRHREFARKRAGCDEAARETCPARRTF